MRINFLKKAVIAAGSGSLLLTGCVDTTNLLGAVNVPGAVGAIVNGIVPVFANSFGISFGEALGANLGAQDILGLLNIGG